MAKTKKNDHAAKKQKREKAKKKESSKASKLRKKRGVDTWGDRVVPQDKDALKKEKKLKGVGGGGQYEQDRRFNATRWSNTKGIKRKRENLIAKHKYEKQAEKDAKRPQKKNWRWSADQEEEEEEGEGDDGSEDDGSDEDGSAAYSSLLGALAPNMKKYDAMLKQRRLEEQGEAEEDEEEEDEEMGLSDEGEGEEDEEGDDDEEGEAEDEEEEEEEEEEGGGGGKDGEATEVTEVKEELLLDCADDHVDESSDDPFKRHYYETVLSASRISELTAPAKIRYQPSGKAAAKKKTKKTKGMKGANGADESVERADVDPFEDVPNLVTEGQVVTGSDGVERTVAVQAGGAAVGGVSKESKKGKKGKKGAKEEEEEEGGSATTTMVSLAESGVKPAIASRWLETRAGDGMKGPGIKEREEFEGRQEKTGDKWCAKCGMTPVQAGLFNTISGYHDTLFTGQTLEDGWEEQLREVLAMHVLNHTQKARDRVARHNTKIRCSMSTVSYYYHLSYTKIRWSEIEVGAE
jgi:hypothetical protein